MISSDKPSVPTPSARCADRPLKEELGGPEVRRLQSLFQAPAIETRRKVGVAHESAETVPVHQRVGAVPPFRPLQHDRLLDFGALFQPDRYPVPTVAGSSAEAASVLLIGQHRAKRRLLPEV